MVTKASDLGTCTLEGVSHGGAGEGEGCSHYIYIFSGQSRKDLEIF